jgi:hypothetical protein
MQGPAAVNVNLNGVTFNGTGATGLRFDLAQSANVNLASNVITDNAGGGTGILFTSIASAANVTVNDNVVQLFGNGALIDRGIIFSSVSGPLDLIGTLNNTVTNATTPFFVPFGSAVGQFFINGVPVP